MNNVMHGKGNKQSKFPAANILLYFQDMWVQIKNENRKNTRLLNTMRN